MTEVGIDEADESHTDLTFDGEDNDGSVSRIPWHISASIERVGLSIIDGKPQEIVYLCVDGVEVAVSTANAATAFEVTIRKIQADNQSNYAPFKTFICPRPLKPDEDFYDAFECRSCGEVKGNSAVFHFCFERSSESGSTAYFKRCSFWTAPITIQIDEGLLGQLRSLFNQVSRVVSDSDDIYTHKSLFS